MHTPREFAFYALGRAGYGASPGSLQELQSIGFPAWVEEQLAPQRLDADADERIRRAVLRIKYPAGDGWPATAVYAPEPGVTYDPAYELGRPLKTLAQLIKMDLGLQAATVDLGGWDTHEYQPGRFKNQVERLSQGLGAFYNDMTRYQDRLIVVVVTEFSRRLRSNRSNGTDHGRGSVMMVLGGRVAGGTIYGRWPGLKSDQLEEGVDLAVVNDYRHR